MGGDRAEGGAPEWIRVHRKSWFPLRGLHHVRTQEEVGVRDQGGLSLAFSQAGTLVSDSQPPELRVTQVCGQKPPSPWHCYRRWGRGRRILVTWAWKTEAGSNGLQKVL